MTSVVRIPSRSSAKGGEEGPFQELIAERMRELDAWGKMRYRLSGSMFDFVFNGHELTPGQSYTLIYYPDPWPGQGLICLGTNQANEDANVHIKGFVETGDLPADYDDNTEGAKIWLVLTDDVNCDEAKMVGWNPSEYLFEHNLITFDDTDE